ncbi:hypothetical protein IJG14_02325 [bacterium]|nr:hypothetical protein [bacterium]
MYSQRDSLQIELEKIENKKRLSFQRYQIEQQRINNNLELETAKIYHQATCRFMQNIIPNQCVMQKRTYMQQPQNYQTQYVNAYPNGLTNPVQYKEQNYYQQSDYNSQNKSFKTHSSQVDEYIKMIYEHAKNTIEQMSTKAFLTPEEQYYYSELKDAMDFIEAGQTLQNPNNSFVSKLDAAKKAADILNKHLHIY